MDADTLRWLGGIALAVIASLIGVIYWSLRSEQKRQAKNTHSLRNLVQAVVVTLASYGIKIPGSKDDE